MLKDLEWRGLLNAQTPDLRNALHQPEGLTLYIGIDPTASSLHVGSLLPIVCLNKFIEHNYNVVVLLGGGTAMIGDPSGKRNERQMLMQETIDANLSGIKEQITRLVPKAVVVNNAEWWQGMSFLGILRTVGKHFSLNYMRAKDSVKSREEEGISYTEFSYMLLQAYDFQYLHDNHGCTLQIGGSDQWGNITCGIDLIKKYGGKAHGMTFPLLTASNGEKFGKSMNGTVWLDPKRTSPYHFHQFWLNTDDKDVVQYLKYFTALPEEHIKNMEELIATYAKERVAQKTLADAVTRLVHGEAAVVRANQVRELLFGKGGDLSSLTKEEIDNLFDSSIQKGPIPLPGDGLRTVDIFERLGIFGSKGQARRAIEGGGVYVNGNQLSDAGSMITSADLLHERYIVLRKGKKDFTLIVMDPVPTIATV